MMECSAQGHHRYFRRHTSERAWITLVWDIQKDRACRRPTPATLTDSPILQTSALQHSASVCKELVEVRHLCLLLCSFSFPAFEPEVRCEPISIELARGR